MAGQVLPISAVPELAVSNREADVKEISQLRADECYFIPLEGRYAQHNEACILRTCLRKRGVGIQTRMSPKGLYVCRKSNVPSYPESGPVGAILDERGKHE